MIHESYLYLLKTTQLNNTEGFEKNTDQ